MALLPRRTCLVLLTLSILGWHPTAFAASPAEEDVHAGIAADKAGDFAQADADFAEAIGKDPDYAPAYYNRGYAYYLESKLENAISAFSQALSINPKYQDAYLFRGIVLTEKNNLEDSITDFNSFIALNSKDARAYSWRAVARYLSADFAAAIADSDTAIGLSPNPVYYLNRGLAKRANGDRPGALDDFKKSSALGYPYGAIWLWIMECENGAPPQARSDLFDYLARNPANPANVWPRAIADYLLENTSENEFLAGAQGQESSMEKLSEANFFIGVLHRSKGDFKGAAIFFGHCLDVGMKSTPEYVESQRALATLPAQ